jgi:hypothetical protein
VAPAVKTTKRDGGAGEVPLRVVVVRPPAGVRLGVQRGRDEIVGAADSVGEDLAFDFAVRVIDDGGGGKGAAVRLGGPFVQGPAGGKFVYVCSGAMAGQAGSCWSRRAKVPLAGVTARLVREAMNGRGARLEARFDGTGRDGGPSCASVKLVGDGWRVARG